MASSIPDPNTLIESHTRHERMVSILAAQRRRLLSSGLFAPTPTSEYEVYRYLISDHLSGSGSIYEIISDGFDSISEPGWHGLITAPGRTSITLIEPAMLVPLRTNMEKRRKTKIHCQYRTHLEIGSLLSESVLFRVHGNEVRWLENFKWSELTSPIFPLLDPSDRDGTITNVLDSMRAISNNVLWPQLFESEVDRTRCFSFVYIMTTSWSFSHGVWALHGITQNNQLFDDDDDLNTNLRSSQQLIAPAFVSIVDAARAVLETDSLWPRRRQGFVRFCMCIGQPPHAVEDGIKSGTNVDQRILDATSKLFHLRSSLTLPTALRILFDMAVSYLADFIEPISDDEGELKVEIGEVGRLLYGALQHYFVGNNLNDNMMRGLCFEKAYSLVVELMRQLRIEKDVNALTHELLDDVKTILSRSDLDISEEGRLACEKACEVVSNFEKARRC